MSSAKIEVKKEETLDRSPQNDQKKSQKQEGDKKSKHNKPDGDNVKNEEETVDEEEESTSEEEPIEYRVPNAYDLVREFSSGYFLNKHTQSFKCFEQNLCSSSDLLLTLSFFPTPVDPGIDEVFNYVASEELHDVTGSDRYLQICKEHEIIPFKRIMTSLGTDTLNLKYYAIPFLQMKGIAEALKLNVYVQHVIFEEICMSPEATQLISDILRDNNTIRTLNMKECRIGPEGAEKLNEGIWTTQSLQELDLSFNSLGDEGLQAIKVGLTENTSIKKLNISHNELTEDSGDTLKDIFSRNKYIEALDLSWNCFNTGPGNKKLFAGLSASERISWLNMSWNGIETLAATGPIINFIKKSTTLKFLDLSWNRIANNNLVRKIANCLFVNKSLTEVKIGHNIYSPGMACSLAVVLSLGRNKLKKLDMEDMRVFEDIAELDTHIELLGKKVIYGRIMRDLLEGPNPDINKILFMRCKYLTMKPKKKKFKKDFGHFILSLPDTPITKQDFEVKLKQAKVKNIDKDLLTMLLHMFSTKQGLKIDCAAMKEAYMALWPDTVLPPPPEKEGKKGKKKKGKKSKKKAGEQSQTKEKEGEKSETKIAKEKESEKSETKITKEKASEKSKSNITEEKAGEKSKSNITEEKAGEKSKSNITEEKAGEKSKIKITEEKAIEKSETKIAKEKADEKSKTKIAKEKAGENNKTKITKKKKGTKKLYN